LRAAFSEYINVEGKSLLPSEIIWRKKEAFSDGVTAQNTCLSNIINNQLLSSGEHFHSFVNDSSLTSEQLYYKFLFEKYFKTLDHIVPYYWMPKFIEGVVDASARNLSIYNEL
jgi:asparagine synthase (glutamine-hydrolysing)